MSSQPPAPLLFGFDFGTSRTKAFGIGSDPQNPSNTTNSTFDVPTRRLKLSNAKRIFQLYTRDPQILQKFQNQSFFGCELTLDQTKRVVYKVDKDRLDAYPPSVVTKKIIDKALDQFFTNIATEGSLFVVLTTPVDFAPQQCSALIRIVELHAKQPQVIAVVPEPIAATIKHMNMTVLNANTEQNVIVVDFGAGTLDLSAVKVRYDNASTLTFHVEEIDGERSFGGSNFTTKLMQLYKTKFVRAMNKWISQSQRFSTTQAREAFRTLFTVWLDEQLNRMEPIVEEKKTNYFSKLQAGGSVDLELDAVMADGETVPPEILAYLKDAPEDAKRQSVTFEEWQACVTELMGTPETSTQDTFMGKVDSFVKKCQANPHLAGNMTVLLVGGAFRVPSVVATCKAFFAKVPNCTVRDENVDNDLVLAEGAKIFGDALMKGKDAKGRKLVVQSIVPRDIGVMLDETTFQPVVPKGQVVLFSQVQGAPVTSVTGRVTLINCNQPLRYELGITQTTRVALRLFELISAETSQLRPLFDFTPALLQETLDPNNHLFLTCKVNDIGIFVFELHDSFGRLIGSNEGEQNEIVWLM